MIDPEFESAAAAVRSSTAYRIVRSACERIDVAMRESRLVVPMRSAVTRFASLTPGLRLRAQAMTVAWASLGHLAFRMLLPRYATSGLPWWWNGVIAVAATGIALMAGRIAPAWGDSMAAQWCRRVAP